MRYAEMEFGAARLRDGAEPETPPGFARVRVLACGVCATDLHLLHGMVLPRGAAYPVRPGHEIAGIVEHVNGDGARVKEGDLAILHPLATCGECEACLRGEDQRCASLRTLGMHDAGGFAEFVVWPVLADASGQRPRAKRRRAAVRRRRHRAQRAQARRGSARRLAVRARRRRSGDRDARRRAGPGPGRSPRRRGAQRARAPSACTNLASRFIAGLVGAARSLRHSVGRMDAVIDFSGQPGAPAEGVGMLQAWRPARAGIGRRHRADARRVERVHGARAAGARRLRVQHR